MNDIGNVAKGVVNSISSMVPSPRDELLQYSASRDDPSRDDALRVYDKNILNIRHINDNIMAAAALYKYLYNKIVSGALASAAAPGAAAPTAAPGAAAPTAAPSAPGATSLPPAAIPEVGKLHKKLNGVLGANSTFPRGTIMFKDPVIGGSKHRRYLGGEGENPGSGVGAFFMKELDTIEQLKDAGNEEAMKMHIDNVVNHPSYNKTVRDIDTVDRLIFISTTFILRGLTLFLLDWGINSYLVDSFTKAFYMYIVIYTILFLVIVMIANMSSENDFSKNFKLLFYYIYVGNNGVGRIAIHLTMQILLIPIMLVVNQNKSGSTVNALDYEGKRRIYRVITNLTMFFWVLTSVIAMRY